MIKKLRLKFIAISTLSMVIVLFVILGSINLLNYREMVQNSDMILNLLVENNGVLSKNVYKSKQGNHGKISPETSFESRYFSVFLKKNNTTYEVDTDKIAAVDEDQAVFFAQQLNSHSKERGFISSYRYVKKQTSEGTKIFFLDCTRSVTSFRAFLFSSLFVSALGIVAVFLLVVLLSKMAVDPVSESYEKQKRFITDAGHEIKTPLTIIDADTSILEMEYGESEWIKDIQMQTKRLAGLTNDLIYLSRMEEENTKLQMIDFPFSDVAMEIAQSFQNLAKVQGKVFEVKIDPMLNLCGDENAIRQLLSIFLDNAVKYSGDRGKIYLDIRKKGKNLKISVYNTAQSITKENIEHLFDRFYRTDASRNSETGGYGIGLSIAKAVVAAHKGKITASSMDGKSLLITVIL